MNETVKIDSINEILNYKAKDMLPFLGGLIFICADLTRAVLRFLIPSFSWRESLVFGLQDAALAIIAVLYYLIMLPSKTKKLKIWPIYLLAFGSIIWSLAFHPEYSAWFNHDEYGLTKTILHTSSAVFGLLFFSLFRDKTKLVTALTYSCRLNLVWHLYEYASYLRRGYWTSYLGDGTLAKLSYGLNFGYRVAICAVFFLALFVFNKKNIDLVSFVVSFVLIVVGGSRGPLVCISAACILLYLFVWKKAPKKSVKFYLMLLLLVAVAVAIVNYLPLMINGLLMLSKRANISGRAIQMLQEGTLFNDSGRSDISRIAYNMIENGGLFGYGFYGDRYVIGRTWYYGYPHNICLELLIQYGPLAGGAMILILFFNIGRFFFRCADKTWELLIITTFCASIKLWLSDSFWYFWPFWAMLAVIGLWNKERRAEKSMI